MGVPLKNGAWLEVPDEVFSSFATKKKKKKSL